MSAMTDLQAGGELQSPALLGSGSAFILIEQILELDLAFFEAGGVDVGQIVGDHIQVQLL